MFWRSLGLLFGGAALLACGADVTTVPSAAGGAGTGGGTGASGGAGGNDCAAEGCGAVRWSWRVDDAGDGMQVMSAAATDDGGILAASTLSKPVDLGFGLMDGLFADWDLVLIAEIDGADGSMRAAQVAYDPFQMSLPRVVAGPTGQRLFFAHYLTDVFIDDHQHTTPVAPYVDDSFNFLPGYEGGITRGKMVVASLDEGLGVEWSLSFGDERYPPVEPDPSDGPGGPGPHFTTLAFDAHYDDDGSVVVVGGFTGMITAGALELTRRGLSDGFVMRLSSSGQPLWLRGYGGRGATLTPWSVVGRGDGGFTMVGTLAGDVQLGAVALSTQPRSAEDGWGFYDARSGFVAACDADGDVLWGHSYSGWPVSRPQPLADDGVWLAVAFDDDLRVDGVPVISAPGSAVAVLEFAADGSLAASLAPFEEDEARSVRSVLRAPDGTLFASLDLNFVEDIPYDAIDGLGIEARDPGGALRWRHDLPYGVYWDFVNRLVPALIHDGDPIWMGSAGPTFELGGQTFEATPDPPGWDDPSRGQDALIVKLAR